MPSIISKLEIDNFEKLYIQCFEQNILLFADYEMQFQNADKFFMFYISNQDQENFEYYRIDDYILIIDYKKKVIEIFNEYEILTYQKCEKDQLIHCVNCSKMYLSKEK